MSDVEPTQGAPWSAWTEPYTAALLGFAVLRNAAALRRTQEIARKALDHGLMLADLSALHHEAVRRVLLRAAGQLAQAAGTDITRGSATLGAEDATAVITRANTVFSTVLSLVETDYREVWDARAALRRENEVLEQRAGRVAHGLLDETGQLLASLHLSLEAIARELPGGDERLDKAKSLLYDIEDQLRNFAGDLRPTILDHLGLTPAIEYLAQRVTSKSGIPISVESTIGGRVSPTVEAALYRAVEEALANVHKHANARRASIRLRRERNAITCVIEDDGVGFDAGETRLGSERRLGLIGVQERIRELGGTLEVHSAPGHGTDFRVSVPEPE